MKLIIAGSRTIHNISAYTMLQFIQDNKIDEGLGLYDDFGNELFEIVSGTANGIDKCGEHFAKHFELPLTRFPADWNKYGNSAGPIRNKQMAEYADALLLIWDGKSKGSANMKETMLKLGKPVYEVIIKVP